MVHCAEREAALINGPSGGGANPANWICPVMPGWSERSKLLLPIPPPTRAWQEEWERYGSVDAVWSGPEGEWMGSGNITKTASDVFLEE